MKAELPLGYSFIRRLGGENKRKFNEVNLMKHVSGELFVLKTCLLSDSNACALLLREFQFYFEHNPSLPQKSVLDKSSTHLHLLLPFKKGELLSSKWKSLKKNERTAFLNWFVPTFIHLLHDMHQQGVFHNDIRPGNILIDDENIHLIDFGMAGKKGEKIERSTLFSLAYSSPELILNHTDWIDETSDLFSLGMMLIELMSGQPLLHDKNPAVLTQLAITYPVRLKGVIPNEFVPILEQLCLKPTFRTSPNRMPQEEVLKTIRITQEQRKIANLSAKWEEACASFQRKKRWQLFNRFQIA